MPVQLTLTYFYSSYHNLRPDIKITLDYNFKAPSPYAYDLIPLAEITLCNLTCHKLSTNP